MKKIVLTILTVLTALTAAMAQPRRPLDAKPNERIHAAKMVYLVDKLHLTAEQAGNFTGLYNEYETDVRNTRQAFYRKYKGRDLSEADEATSKQYIDDDLDYQQQVIELKRKYRDRFLRVISPQQLADMYRLEREFKQMLMKKLENRRDWGRRR